MSRKLISACTSLALVAGLLLVASPATQAQTGAAPANVGLFQPNSFGLLSAEEQKTVLSDAFDGVDEAAHITGVASANATQMTFYVCTVGPGLDLEARGAALKDPGLCQAIDTDTSLNQPVPPDAATFFAGSWKAGSAHWNIPAGLDQAIVTIAVRACAGAPSSTETDNEMPDNCRADWEDGVVLDDGATPAFPGTPRQFETGQMMDICLDSAAACLSFGAGGTGAGVYEPFPNGARIPRAGQFSLRFRTSNGADTGGTAPGVAATEVGACLDTDISTAVSHGAASIDAARAGDDIEPTGCDHQATSVTLNDNPTGYKEWVANFTGLALGAPGDRTNVDVAIFGARGPGTADDPDEPCTTDHFTGMANTCVYDEHFAVAADLARQSSGTFQFDPTTPLPAGSGNCEQPRTTETNRLGTVTVFVFCLFDAAGQPVSMQEVTFEHDGSVGFFDACGPGTAGGVTAPETGPHPAAPPPAPQQCHTETDGDGLAHVILSNPNEETSAAGDQVVTACRDPEASLLTHPDHGCGNAPAAERATGTKTWTFVPDHIFLVFINTGDPADPCRTGDQAKNNLVDDQDTLLACVFDLFGRPAHTLHQGNPDEGVTDFQLAWTRDPGCQAIGFVGSLATETGPDGQAMQNIRAVQTGACQIFVELIGGDGDGGLTITGVSKNAQRDPDAGPHDDPRAIGLQRFRGPRLRPRRVVVRGRVRVVRDHVQCLDQVPVRVQRRFLRGRGSQRFNTLRTIITASDGSYRTRVRRAARPHRIRVIAVPLTIGDHNCLRAVNSRRVRRR